MKKFLVSLCTAASLLCTSAYAFTFPTPDWGALLAEKQAMVSEADFELYTEGSLQNAPYYGARLEPRAGAYIGMIAETSDKFAPLGSYLTYIQDMGQDDLYYPANNMIKNSDSVAMVGWTVFDMSSVDLNHVKNVLDTLNTYGKPMFIRFANEMNVSALGDNPELYKSVFRNVADMVHQYPNFATVWSPNDPGALDRPFEYFYPGDEYVDWIGVSCYSIKYFQGNPNADPKSQVYFMTGDNAWSTNRLKPIIEFMRKNNINKPLMLSESGVAISNSYDENLETWSTPRLRNLLWNTIMKFPQIKMINYFNTHRADETEKFDISGYTYAESIFAEAASSGAYIRSANGNPQFVFTPANGGETLAADSAGNVNLYTLAHIPGTDTLSVNYAIDGNWYHCSGEIPYKCSLNIRSLADGEHTVRIWAYNYDKNYTFVKSGNAIRFGGAPDPGAAAPDGISVTLNGETLSFDTEPMLINDRTMVPMRKIFESLGATVDWDESTQTVTAKRGGTVIRLKIDSERMTVGGNEKILDAPAQLVGDRTLVPVRAISESLGAEVEWDDATRTVIITNVQ